MADTRAALTALVEKWRKDAENARATHESSEEFRHEDKEIAIAIDECADELEAVIAVQAKPDTVSCGACNWTGSSISEWESHLLSEHTEDLPSGIVSDDEAQADAAVSEALDADPGQTEERRLLAALRRRTVEAKTEK